MNTANKKAIRKLLFSLLREDLNTNSIPKKEKTTVGIPYMFAKVQYGKQVVSWEVDDTN
jgi:hypothetical protein